MAGFNTAVDNACVAVSTENRPAIGKSQPFAQAIWWLNLGTGDLNGSYQSQVFPNPNTGQFSITLDLPAPGPVFYWIFAADGSLVGGK